MKTVKVLFVCSGNICRSPLAEGIFNAKVAAAGLSKHIHAESAGIGKWHEGELPDPRSIDVAKKHGVSLTSRAKQILIRDFSDFDYIIAMDTKNENDLLTLAGDSHRRKVQLMRNWDTQKTDKIVPDPYYGKKSDFETVYQILDRCIENFFNQVNAEL